MTTRTKTAPPTEDEVMAALLRETVSEIGTGADSRRMTWSPASRLDVAHRIAMARGWNGEQGWTEWEPGKPRTGSYPGTREKGINRYVSAKAVGDVLEQFRRDGRVHGFYGRHKLISGKYGINPASVYYLTPEALDVALAERRRFWVQAIEADAIGEARTVVLARHADEVEVLRVDALRRLEETEPDWLAQLDEDPTARPA